MNLENPTSARYLLRSPPNPTGVVEYDGDGFEHLVDVAERLAELKWKWSRCLTVPPATNDGVLVAQKKVLDRDKWAHLFQNRASFEEDKEVRLARWMNEAWVAEPPSSQDAVRPTSQHLREGIYVIDQRSHTNAVEPVPWYQIPGLERLVAERLPPEDSTSSGADSSFAPSKDKGPIWVEDKVVRAVVRAMLTRPLVLLAGISGSGKTQLARRLGLAWAEGVFRRADSEASAIVKLQTKGCIALHAEGGWTFPDREPRAERAVLERYGFLAVQSDWTDASHLWGYHVPLPAEAEGFYGTEALRVFLEAQTSAEQHFLLLDEMNLSRPEHYASDLLSAMEVQGDAVIHLHRAGDKVRLRGAQPGASVRDVPRRIAWPEGLVVIGSVNVDETTFSFAPKVLDRAALLEFTDIELKKAFGTGKHSQWAAAEWWFDEIHRVCRPYNLHLGYRAAKEVLDALAKSSDAAAVLDLQLCNKVLPRIRGPRASVETLLLELLPLAKSRGTKASLAAKTPTSADARSAYVEKINSDGFKVMCASERKIAEMLRRAYTVGFTSYFG